MKKIKVALSVYAALLILLTVFRCFQLNLAIDPLTGFTQIQVTNIILYGALILFLLFALVYIYYAKETQNVKSELSLTSKVTPYIILVYAAVLLFTSVIDLGNLLKVNMRYMENTNLLLIFIFRTVTASFGFLTGFVLVVQVFKAISQKENYITPGIPCFITILHSALSLLTFFVKERTLVTISQNLLTLFFWMCAVEFIFAYSRYLCSSKIGKPFHATLVSSMMTSVLGAVIIIAPVFAKSQSYYSFTDSERLVAIPIFLLATSVLTTTAIRVFKDSDKFLKN